MTEQVEVGPAEILRCGVWSLRGLGMKYGVAERAAPWLAWTEGVEGGALKSLRENETAIEQAASNPIDRAELTSGHWRLEVPGKSLLEVGPIAVDLLTYAARSVGHGRVDIHGVVDPIFASAICRLATRRGLAIGAHAAGPELCMAGMLVRAMQAYPGAGDQAWFSTGPLAGEKRAVAVENLTNFAADSLPLSLSVIQHTGDQRADPGPWVDLDRRFREAEARGIMVDKADLDSLYALEMRSWAPTSERSRRQALV